MGACVMRRSAATASRALGSVVPASMATTNLVVTMKARFEKS